MSHAAQPAGDQPQSRRHRLGWRFWAGWLALTQFAALVIAVINVFHPVGLRRQVPVGYLLTWPVVISPAWAGVIAALAALLVMTRIWQRLGGTAGTG